MKNEVEANLDYALCIENHTRTGFAGTQRRQKTRVPSIPVHSQRDWIENESQHSIHDLERIDRKGFIERSGNIYYLTEKGVKALQAFVRKFNKVKLHLEGKL